MSGDYTRFSFDPLKRYSGVLMQQGRVQLDSDWNEEIDILRRRLRTTALDTFGPVGVPYLVKPGRLRNRPDRGTADRPVDRARPSLRRRRSDRGLRGRRRRPTSTSHSCQPRFRPPLPAGDAVVYLDVWDREVTYIEDPELLDVALGGADTTTRVQTVWQLRVERKAGSRLRPRRRRAAIGGTPDDPGDRAAGARRSLHTAAGTRLSRAGEPALPDRDP